jgi:hypothetical protein
MSKGFLVLFFKKERLSFRGPLFSLVVADLHGGQRG